MKPIQNWDSINEAGEVKSLPAGAYALKIRDVVNVPEREYLEVYFDIAEGPYKGYYTFLEENTGKPGIGKTIRSYKNNALTFFKAFTESVNKSNPGYRWEDSWDENTLKGKFCAGEFGEEEYVKDGEVKVGVKLVNFRSLQALREGKCKIPERKLLPEDQKPVAVNDATPDVNDDDLPF